LIDLAIKEHLQPTVVEDGQHIGIPRASYSIGNAQKDLFLKVLKDAKPPYGCVSNISRCVYVKERKLADYKSHDAHILLHYPLQVAVRNSLLKKMHWL